MRIDAKNHVVCAMAQDLTLVCCTSIISSDGHSLPWVSEMRYLGI